MVVSCFFSLNSFNLYSSLRKALRVVNSRFYAEEDTDAYGLKVDVKKFLFDMRMHAKLGTRLFSALRRLQIRRGEEVNKAHFQLQSRVV
ncbi:hypothetical protein Pyn_20169 [Prunus yedoensis var. nudiflora]|uniref:Uncharacterized protein n=1 Tax=Prunus yedoensis var. nudiflora TaxID=2094558 RepID=A0A314YKM1_PRUYE|nr:hypothetical protein Pyn_20169 [Prunus yedoensis var. nudiflora]